MFMTLLALLIFSLDNLWGWLVGSSMLASVPYQAYVAIYKHPELEMKQREEDLAGMAHSSTTQVQV